MGTRTSAEGNVVLRSLEATLEVTKAPKHKAKVKGIVKITASSTDRFGVARVQLLIDGKVVATDSKAGDAFSINSKKYGKKFKVQLRAYDRAGNARTTTARTWYR
jgi:Bacterial Ig domain